MTKLTKAEREKRDALIRVLHERDHYSERQIARAVGTSRTTVWTVLQAAKAARR